MKKLVLALAVVGGVAALSSCKKDWTCSCTTTTTGTVNSTTTVDTVFTDMKKDEAETACTAGNSSVSFLGQTVSVECAIQ